jgi:hypothetical protein
MGPSLDEARRRHRHARMIAAAGIAIVVGISVLIWVISLISRDVLSETTPNTASPATRTAPVLPVGPPRPQRLAEAVLGRDEPGLRLQLPIRREAVTGVGFGTRDSNSVAELQPAGERANLSWGHRLIDRFLSTDPPGDLSWYHLQDGTPSTVVVGAAPGTDAYAPIEGRVLAIVPYIVSGEHVGETVQLQPLGDARTVVVIRGLDADPKLQAGQAVVEGVTPIGTVRDLHGLVEAPLAQFTHDSGSGLELYVSRSETHTDLSVLAG